MTSCRQCLGGGVLVNVLKAEGDDVTRAMSKVGGACVLVNVFTPPPPPLQEILYLRLASLVTPLLTGIRN